MEFKIPRFGKKLIEKVVKLDRKCFRRAAAAAAICVAAGTLSSTAFAAPLTDGEVMNLWPGKAPGSENVTFDEVVVERSSDPNKKHDRAMMHIKTPTLTVRLPEHPNGTAVVIAPGGGYARVVIDKESEEYAEHWLNPAGVTAFILHYRMPSDPHNSNRTDVMLEDGQRAMRIVRAHAQEWGIDPNKIGIMGSSAGGHLASSINAEYDHEFYKHVDASDDVSAKPDFAILCYPVITMQDKWAHNGTKKRLLGMNPTQEEKDRYSSELYVTKNTSPSFIVLAEDDDVVPSMNGVLYFQALRANGVMNSEIHVFRRGGHGFGIERIADDNALGMWPKLATNWLQGIGMLPKVTK